MEAIKGSSAITRVSKENSFSPIALMGIIFSGDGPPNWPARYHPTSMLATAYVYRKLAGRHNSRATKGRRTTT